MQYGYSRVIISDRDPRFTAHHYLDGAARCRACCEYCVLRAAYCVLRTENIFVCCCSVGSDRAAEVGVSLGTLDLVRVDVRRAAMPWSV